MEKSSLTLLSFYFKWDCCSVVSLTPPPSPHFLLKCVKSLALLTHTNWNLTHASKSFLFGATGAFRGYLTPAKLTGDHFLSPFCFSSLHSPYSLIALFVSPPAHWHLNFPSLSLLHSSLLIFNCSHFYSESLSCYPNLAHLLLHAPFSILSQIDWWTIRLGICLSLCACVVRFCM